MKRVLKRNMRSKTICEFRDEGQFMNIEFSAVASCRVLEQSMVLCLLVVRGTICFDILAMTGESFFGEALFLIF